MAEINCALYFRHPQQETHDKLIDLFELANLNGRSLIHDFGARKEEMIELAAQIDSVRGGTVASALFNDLHDKYREELLFDELTFTDSYCVVSCMFGGSGDRALGRVLSFLYRLCPDIHAQAWGMGDDDPWEFWYKYDNGSLVRLDDEPYSDDDGLIKGTIYRWWHADMPEIIQEGLLSDDENDEEDDHTTVSDTDYEQWLDNVHSNNIDSAIEDIATEEMVDVFKDVIGDLFGGLFGSERKKTKAAVSTDAISADTLSEDLVRQVFADLETAEKNFDLDGMMKHYAKDLKGTITMVQTGSPVKFNLSHTLIRMGLKLLLREDAEYQNNCTINRISKAEGRQFVANLSIDSTYIDPDRKAKMHSISDNDYTFDLIDGKVQIAVIESTETLFEELNLKAG